MLISYFLINFTEGYSTKIDFITRSIISWILFIGESNLLIISWIHLKEKKKITASSMQPKEYKEIDNYKPSGNLTYNKSNLNVLNSKTNLLFR